jgi:hypothetical protein
MVKTDEFSLMTLNRDLRTHQTNKALILAAGEGLRGIFGRLARRMGSDKRL